MWDPGLTEYIQNSNGWTSTSRSIHPLIPMRKKKDSHRQHLYHALSQWEWLDPIKPAFNQSSPHSRLKLTASAFLADYRSVCRQSFNLSLFIFKTRFLPATDSLPPSGLTVSAASSGFPYFFLFMVQCSKLSWWPVSFLHTDSTQYTLKYTLTIKERLKWPHKSVCQQARFERYWSLQYQKNYWQTHRIPVKQQTTLNKRINII